MISSTRRYFFLFLLLVLANVSNASQTASVLALDSSVTNLNLEGHLQYYEDRDGRLTAEDLATQPGLLQPYEKPTVNEGYNNSTWWFSFQLYNNEQLSIHWWLDVDYPLLDEIDLYEVDPATGGLREIGQTGDMRPMSSRAAKTSNFVFPLLLQPQHEYRYLVRVKSTGSIILPASLHSNTEFIEYYGGQRLLTGIFHGGALFLMLYNIGLWLSVRERLYLYYVLYVGCFLLITLTTTGVGFELLWQDQYKFQSVIVPAAVVTTAIFGLLFARNLLDLGERSPALYRISQYLLIAGIAILVVNFFLPYTLAC